MKIIIAPAKKMRVDTDSIAPSALPQFLDQTRMILDYLKSLSYDELKKLWQCNDQIAQENYERLEVMDLTRNLTPAILAYDGIQYQYMAPSVFTAEEFQYVEDNLRILSGFYGLLKPLDGVTPYRLEMQARTKLPGNLYNFWNDKIYQALIDDSRIIINLASKEYAKAVERYLTEDDLMITCFFGEYNKSGKLVAKGVYAKMARGEMVRFMATHHVTDPEQIKAFHELGYVYNDELSTNKEYIFIRQTK
ncbi:MAG: peroxide stress protein YaaA [Erysipelotrichaceae bacterium]|nr:peroxide stress protein YaaA [Erysipelotrichaceae bacterium]